MSRLNQWTSWYLWRRWTAAVRDAFRACNRDKGYISVGDYEQIRFDKDHWALNFGAEKEKRSQ